MKMTKILTIVTILSLAAFGTSFASDELVALWSDAGGSYGSPPITIKPSKNVKVAYFHSDAVSGSGRLTSALSAWNASGTKTFATSSGDTKIFSTEGLAIAAPAPPEAANVGAVWGAGWTAL